MIAIRNLFILFLIIAIKAYGQDFTPIVKQFVKQEYGASNQNWSVAQDSKGLMYFANNKGLLQFDGNHWELINAHQYYPGLRRYVS